MDDPDKLFDHSLNFKLQGGVPVEVFVSNGVWLGGMFESQSHQPFVALGPAEWESEEELTFFATREDVDSFLAEVRKVRDAAFPQEPDKPQKSDKTARPID